MIFEYHPVCKHNLKEYLSGDKIMMCYNCYNIIKKCAETNNEAN